MNFFGDTSHFALHSISVEKFMGPNITIFHHVDTLSRDVFLLPPAQYLLWTLVLIFGA